MYCSSCTETVFYTLNKKLISYFGNIIPCGIIDKQVTSLQKELEREVDMEEVKNKLKNHISNLFEMELIQD